MADETSLADVFTSAAADYFGSQSEPGMMTGFVAVTEVMLANGDTKVIVSHAPGQHYAHTLGLLAVGDVSTRSDVAAAFGD